MGDRDRAFRTPLRRNAFLVGCLDFTEHEPVEHLIVGFGEQRGNAVIVSHMAHNLGTEGAVSIPAYVGGEITGWIGSGHARTVILFHNHPRNVINAAIDNTPLPSGTDRRALAGFYSSVLPLMKFLTGGGGVRCYIGENGFVREFTTPDILYLLRLLNDGQ
jgi:hypothetical protein